MPRILYYNKQRALRYVLAPVWLWGRVPACYVLSRIAKAPSSWPIAAQGERRVDQADAHQSPGSGGERGNAGGEGRGRSRQHARLLWARPALRPLIGFFALRVLARKVSAKSWPSCIQTSIFAARTRHSRPANTTPSSSAETRARLVCPRWETISKYVVEMMLTRPSRR